MSMSSIVTRSSAGDVKMLDESALHSAADAAAVSEQLEEMSLNVDGSSNFDRVLTENCCSTCQTVSADCTESATASAVHSRTRGWTLDGFVGEYSSDIASDHLRSLDVGDQLLSADDDCDRLVGNNSSRQLSVASGFSSPSADDVTRCDPACECCQGNSRSTPASCEWSELFSCHECSVEFSKHFAHDSLHIILNVVHPSEIDCIVFRDASLNVVKSETYLTKVTSLSCEQYFSILFFCIMKT